MDVVVTVSDKYLWALKPFAYLFNKYWQLPDGAMQKVWVAGYKRPDYELPPNFTFHQIYPVGYPKEKWVDGFVEFMDAVPLSQNFVLLLEDYWLSRKADVGGAFVLANYMEMFPNILRVDLTADRLYAGGARDVGTFDRFDLIEAPGSQYQMSMQAGIWNKGLLKEVFRQLGEHQHSAWDVELEGTSIVNRNAYDMRVIGTRQNLVRYCNGMNNDRQNRVNFSGLSQSDSEYLRDLVPQELL